jgi:hypothetical protein
MSLTVECFRDTGNRGHEAGGAWVYGIGGRPEGPIVIEGLLDVVLRYFEESLDSRYRDCVFVGRDDPIEAESVWGQFVESYLSSQSHTFPHEVVWFLGPSTSVRVAFIPEIGSGQIFANSRKLARELSPYSVAQVLGLIPLTPEYLGEADRGGRVCEDDLGWRRRPSHDQIKRRVAG